MLDPTSRTLTYSRAGHYSPRLVRGHRVIPIEVEGGLPLGILDKQDYRECTFKMERGDLLLLYTDGITEAMTPPKSGESRDLFGVERLDQLLLECNEGSAAACIDRIREGVTAFSQSVPPGDDQTLIAIRCL